jgi:hypothetical protein
MVSRADPGLSREHTRIIDGIKRSACLKCLLQSYGFNDEMKEALTKLYIHRLEISACLLHGMNQDFINPVKKSK